jgi:hypothetical protein
MLMNILAILLLRYMDKSELIMMRVVFGRSGGSRGVAGMSQYS